MRKITTKVVALAAAGMLAAFMLAACGGGSDQAKEEAAEEPAAAEAVDEAAEAVEEATEEAAEAAAEEAAASEDEEAVRAQLQVLADAFKAGMEEGVLGLADDDSMAQGFEMAGANIEDFGNALMALITMEVQSVEVNGDAATGVLALTYPDFEAMDPLLDSALENAAAGVDLDSLSEEEYYKIVVQAIMDAVTSPDVPTTTETFTVELAKVNGEWEIQNLDEIMAALDSVME